MVGKELQRLHLFRADRPGALDDVVDGLVSRLVDQLPADEPGVVLEMGVPDPLGQRLQQLEAQPGRRAFENPPGFRGSETVRQRLMHKGGVFRVVSLPFAGVEARPVPMVGAVRAVDGDVNDRDCPPPDQRRVTGGNPVQPDVPVQVFESHLRDHVQETAAVGAEVQQVLQGVQSAGGVPGNPALSQHPVDGGVFDILVQQVPQGSGPLAGVGPEGALSGGDQVVELEYQVTGLHEAQPPSGRRSGRR